MEAPFTFKGFIGYLGVWGNIGRMRSVIAAFFLFFMMILPIEAKTFRIIKVKRGFYMGEGSSKESQIYYYTNIGREDGVVPGDFLNVYRQDDIAIDEMGITKMKPPIGRIKVFFVDDGISGGKLVSEELLKAMPYKQRPIMVGDTVLPILAFSSEAIFDPSRSEIKMEAIERLLRIAATLKRLSPTTVIVGGHTDSNGDAIYNKQLSLLRALSVKNFLVEQGGVDPHILQPVGYGESEPIVPNITLENKVKNRRIEILVLQ